MPLPLEKIIEAAEKTGFDSELKAGADLLAAKWRVRQNVYYIDKDENKGRELDIYAYRMFRDLENEPEINCHIYLCIEVKKTASPFIFFSSEVADFEGGGGYGLLNWHRNVDRYVLSYDDIEVLRPHSKSARMGRTFASLKDGKPQHIQSGVLSALKAAVHFKQECNEDYSEQSRDICFFIPLLVVDGEIYESYLDAETAALTARQVDSIVHVQNYLSQSYGSIWNQVDVVTLSALPSLLVAYEAWGSHMLGAMKEKRHLLKRGKK